MTRENTERYRPRLFIPGTDIGRRVLAGDQAPADDVAYYRATAGDHKGLRIVAGDQQ